MNTPVLSNKFVFDAQGILNDAVWLSLYYSFQKSLHARVAESVQLDPMGMITAKMSNEVYFSVQAEICRPIYDACVDKFHE